MLNARQIKNKARRDTHIALSVPAYYRATSTGEWLEVDVRIHNRFDTGGELGQYQAAALHDIHPRMIFLRDQVELPARGGLISVEPGEAWRLGEAMEPEGITITAMVTKLPTAETVGLPVRGC